MSGYETSGMVSGSLHSWKNLTFREPCIVIYSYNKSQRDALFLKFILAKKLYIFRTDPLSIIRSISTLYTQQ